MTLDAFEQWMVESNLKRIRAGAEASDQVATLRANGYARVAEAVEQLAPKPVHHQPTTEEQWL